MKVTEHIAKSKSTLFSLEVLPPLKGQHIKSVHQTIETVRDLNPSFINVTYHREEFIYKKRADNLHEKKVVRKRPGTVGICAALQSKFKIDTIPHILCGGFTKEDTENFLIDLDFLEIDNVLALRGDPVKSEPYFHPEESGHRHAKDLIGQINELNQGQYLEKDLENTSATNFCIGAAAYPEKHMEAPNLDVDVQFLKQKVDAGAEFLITQMFFDNQKYFDFVTKCRQEGITIPIIPGLKPLASKRQLSMLPHRFHVDLPDDLVVEAMKCKTNQAIKELGIEWAIHQSKGLLDFGVPVLHYFSMGKSDNIKSIVSKVL
ncbi:MAG: methylenetetrahydrofolate reductase [Flavobacteriales bacterium]